MEGKVLRIQRTLKKKKIKGGTSAKMGQDVPSPGPESNILANVGGVPECVGVVMYIYFRQSSLETQLSCEL